MASSTPHPKPLYRPFESPSRSIVWPSLPAAGSAQIVALLHQLNQSQWWPAEVMRDRQLRQAGALVSHAQNTVPFYHERLARAGLVPGRPLTREAWARIPLLRRSDIQEAGEQLYSTGLPREHGETHVVSTSGSTGRPIRAKGSRVTEFFWRALTLREHIWQRRDLSGKLVAVRSFANGVADYPGGLASSGWGNATSTIFATGPSAGLHIGSKIGEQAEWLGRQQADYLLIYPSALRELLLHCRRRGLTFPSLRQVRTLSEALSPEIRQLCLEIWGLEIADIYSTQENGYLAFQCAESGAYHVQAESVLLEVLDESGEPCAPGQVGEVVVTSLHNFAMPMLRYAVGDLAEPGDPCPCGRGLAVLKRIHGRVRNVLTYPDGRKAWALIGDMFYTEIPEIRQFQIVQKTVEAVEIRLVVTRPLTTAEEEKVRGWFHQRSGYPFAVAITYHDEISRAPSGKFEDFRSEVAP